MLHLSDDNYNHTDHWAQHSSDSLVQLAWIENHGGTDGQLIQVMAHLTFVQLQRGAQLEEPDYSTRSHTITRASLVKPTLKLTKTS